MDGRRRRILQRINRLLAKPEIVIFTDANGPFRNGKKITIEEVARLKKDYCVTEIKWIEE